MAANGYGFFRHDTVHAPDLLPALRHNKREIVAELDGFHGIDPALVRYNVNMTGNSAAEAFTRYTESRPEKERKNEATAIEIIFDLPFNMAISPDDYFKLCRDFSVTMTEHRWGYLLSFDVHKDEAKPHAHALIIPLDNAGKLRGSAWKGNRNDMAFMREMFRREVCEPAGVLPDFTTNEKKALARLALKTLATPEHASVNRHPLYDLFKESVRRDPVTACLKLGIDIEQVRASRVKKERSFVDIARSRGKGAFIRDEKYIPDVLD